MSMCEYLGKILDCKVSGVDICYNENPQFSISRLVIACFTDKEIKEVTLGGVELKSSRIYENMNAYRTVLLIEPPCENGLELLTNLSYKFQVI